MKLVYLINSLGTGGAERHLLNLAVDMKMRGYSISVAVIEDGTKGGANSLASGFSEAGINIVYLDSGSLGYAGKCYSLVKLLRRLQPDIIHSHLPRSDLLASIAKLILPNILWVSTIHDAYTKDKYSGYWIFPFVKWNFRRADYFVAVSKHVQEWGVRALALSSHKIRVIHHGTPLYVPSDSLQKKISDSMTIGCLARFEKRKGLETLVRAMVEVKKSLPDAKLLLAGSDPTGYSGEISKLVKELNVENNVKILGFCSTPMEFLHGLDVFAFASVSEGFGIVLLEAMSVKCPVVASDIYPINYIVQHEKSGLLIKSGDHHAFSAAIIEILSNPARGREMGEAGYLSCIEEFSLEKSLNKVHDLYVELGEKYLPKRRSINIS